LKILLTNATDISAGGEEYVHTLARYLQMRGHEVLVSGNPNHLLLRKCEASGITTIPIEYGKQAKVFAVAKTLRQMIHNHPIDIIHSNADYDRTCAAIAALFTPAKHIASVHSAHSIQFNLTHWLRNRFAVAHFVTVAEVVREILVREDKIDSNIVTYIPNGVENTTESFRREARDRIRAEWDITPETVVIGNVARLVPFKGHKYLLQSIAQVVAASPNVFFPVLGDGELLSELEQ
jgi:glycosyltransferase involved in cell wall biosynthesis